MRLRGYVYLGAALAIFTYLVCGCATIRETDAQRMTWARLMDCGYDSRTGGVVVNPDGSWRISRYDATKIQSLVNCMGGRRS